MANELTLSSAALTMTSREIADLTGKDHKHVMRDIRAMLAELDETEGGYVQNWTDPQNGQTYTEFRLDRELTDTLLTGYSAIARRKVVARWHELESKTSDPAVALNDPSTLRKVLLGYTEKVIELESQLAEAAPKVAALDRIADAGGLLNMTGAAKALQVQPSRVFNFVRQHGWVYRRAGGRSDVAYQEKIAAGLLTHKVHIAHRDDGSERVCEQVMVTPKGLAKMAQELGLQ